MSIMMITILIFTISISSCTLYTLSLLYELYFLSSFFPLYSSSSSTHFIFYNISYPSSFLSSHFSVIFSINFLSLSFPIMIISIPHLSNSLSFPYSCEASFSSSFSSDFSFSTISFFSLFFLRIWCREITQRCWRIGLGRRYVRHINLLMYITFESNRYE